MSSLQIASARSGPMIVRDGSRRGARAGFLYLSHDVPELVRGRVAFYGRRVIVASIDGSRRYSSVGSDHWIEVPARAAAVEIPTLPVPLVNA